MLKNLSVLELKIGERLYKFLCDMDSPIGEVHDVLSQMKGFVINKMKEAQSVPQEANAEEECVGCEQQ